MMKTNVKFLGLALAVAIAFVFLACNNPFFPAKKISGGVRLVTITGLGAADKIYDGTTVATITGTAVINGKTSGDDVTVNYGTATFNSATVGNNKSVTFNGFSLGGANAENYTLSAQPANTSARIFIPQHSLSQGQAIILGNFWEDYDVKTWNPRSEIEELELEWRKKIQADYGFEMRTRQVVSRDEMQDAIVKSIITGNPVAHAFWVTQDFAMALYNHGLLYPISDSNAVNLKTDTPIAGNQVAYNQDIAAMFTFGGKQYAMSIECGVNRQGAGVYFNKRLFREAGIDPDLPYNLQKAGTWTWDSFLEICKQLTRDVNNDGIIDTFAMTADLSTEILDAFVSANDAMYVDKDSSGRFVNATNRPEFIEAVRYYMRLRDEGVMKPKPNGASWNWYIPEFRDGRVAIRIDQQCLATTDLRIMVDNWGMVLPPRGPKSRDNVVFNNENVIVILSTFSPEDVDKILFAINLWYTPVQVSDDNWKSEIYYQFRDRRSVDETMVLLRNPNNIVLRNHIMIPDLKCGDIAWNMWGFKGNPVELVESVTSKWNALIADANRSR